MPVRWGRGTVAVARRVTRVVGALLALVVISVASLWILAATPWGRRLLAEQVERILAREGVRATLRARWQIPLRLVLEDVRVESPEGGGPPTFEAPRVVVQLEPRLCGPIEVSSIDCESPTLRVVHSPSEQAPATDAWKRARERLTGRWRVRNFGVRDGRADVAWGPVHAAVRGIYVDAHARRDAGGELQIRVAEGEIEEPGRDGAVHDDALCALAVSGTLEPGGVFIEHLEARATADAGHRPPPCAASDPSSTLLVSVSRAAVDVDAEGYFSMAGGHVAVRAPLSLLTRTGALAHLEGWANIDAEVHFTARARLPEVRGTVQAHDVRVGEFRVARMVDARVTLENEVLRVPLADVETTSGKLRVADVELRPLAGGVPIRGRVEGRDLRFEEFLRAIRVARHPHVSWEIETLRWDSIEGTISPFSISGNLAARTATFAVFDGACDVEACERVWSFANSAIAARAALSSDAFAMDDVQATLSGGDAQAAHVLIGFHDELRVENARARLDLARDSPLSSLPIAGQLQAAARVSGQLGDPVVDFGGSVDRFVLDGDPLGDVTSVHGRYHANALCFDAVHARKGASQYDVPSLRIAFGHQGHLEVDAIVGARELAVHDLLSLARLDERYSMLGGSLRDARARVRFVRRGPEDPLGLGTIFVSADAALVGPSAFGEHFDEGTLGVDMRWWDRDAGLAGVDIDIRTLQVRDFGARGAAEPPGSLLASAQLIDGQIRATAVAAALPLARVFSLPDAAGSVEGSVSGVAHAAGTLAALEASADVEVTPLLVGNVAFGPSSMHLDAALGALAPPRVSVHGTLLGGEVYVKELVAHGRELHATAFLNALRLDPIVRAVRAASSSGGRKDGAIAAGGVHAVLSGELTIDALDAMDLPRSRARFVPTAFSASLGMGRAVLQPTGAAIVLDGDAIAVPPLRFDLAIPEQRAAKGLIKQRATGVGRSRASGTGEGSASATLWGSVDSLSWKPHIDLNVSLPDADLGLLVGVVPDLESADGTLACVLRAEGPLTEPVLSGELRSHARTASLSWVPSELRDADVDITLDRRELRVVHASARLGDGIVEATGSSTITGSLPGVATLAVRARSVHLGIARGIDTAFDANARVLIDVRRLVRGEPHAVSVTGDALLDELVYRRTLDTSGTAANESPQEYDPSRDIVDLALRLRLGAPAQLEDDVASVRFVSAGEFWLRGTNQRPTLDGRLVSLRGGKLHVRGIYFDVSHATVDFDDPTAISPRVDLLATTDYRRLNAFETPTTFTSSGARGSQDWRIWLRALGDEGDLRVELTSDPPLSQTDIVLLLTLGLTRPELDAMQATEQLQASAGLEVLAGLGGAQRIVHGVVPIDEVRFGGTYSPLSLVIVPDVTLGKRIGDRLAATVTSSLAYQRIVGGTVSWWLGSNVWFETLWENVAPVPVYPAGNFGLGVRWRLEL